MAAISTIGVLLIMCIMIADILVRTLTGRSLPGAFELIESLIILIVFAGLAHAEQMGTHVRFTFLSQRLPRLAAISVKVVGSAVAVLIGLWLIGATGSEAWDSWTGNEYQSGLLNFPLWPARLVIVLGFIVLTAQLVSRLRDEISELVHARALNRTGLLSKQRSEV